jgi:hypothetical protein
MADLRCLPLVERDECAVDDRELRQAHHDGDPGRLRNPARERDGASRARIGQSCPSLRKSALHVTVRAPDGEGLKLRPARRPHPSIVLESSASCSN